MPERLFMALFSVVLEGAPMIVYWADAGPDLSSCARVVKVEDLATQKSILTLKQPAARCPSPGGDLIGIRSSSESIWEGCRHPGW